MKRLFGSVVSAVVLLSVAVGAAAVNVRILNSNRSDTSPIVAQTAAEVVQTEPSAMPIVPTESAASVDVAVAAATTAASPSEQPQAPLPTPASGKRVLGSVNGGDDDHHAGDHEEEHVGEHGGFWKRFLGSDEEHEGRPERGFVPLTPGQAALLRVAALAQVSPLQARDASNGVGDATVITRVKQAADRIGVPLTEIAAVTDLPPERGRRHGGNDDRDEGDDDD